MLGRGINGKAAARKAGRIYAHHVIAVGQADKVNSAAGGSGGAGAAGCRRKEEKLGALDAGLTAIFYIITCCAAACAIVVKDINCQLPATCLAQIKRRGS